MSKFQKKPCVVEALMLVQVVNLTTPEGTMTGNPGDWLIQGVAGEIYICKGEIFQKTYEPLPVFSVPTAIDWTVFGGIGG